MSINVKNIKRARVHGENLKEFNVDADKPAFRQNGHELVFDSANSDWVNIPSTQIDSFHFVVKVNSYTSQLAVLGDNSGSDLLGLYGTGEVGIQDGSSNFEFLNFGFNPFDLIDIEGVWNGSQYDITLNGSTLTTTGLSSKITFNRLFRRFSTFYFDGEVFSFELNNGTFNPIDIDSSGKIEGSNGTVATVKTSHADGLSYILGTVFQKSSFALVGNGTTQKIVGHLGTDLILTSTPLDGGFTLDGVVYNLTEGLGNEIKSTTGDTATIQGFAGTGLNFGGWQKGNSIDGWTPYTI